MVKSFVKVLIIGIFTVIILASFFLTKHLEIYAFYFLTPYLLSWSIGRILHKVMLPSSLQDYLFHLQSTFEQSGVFFLWAIILKVLLFMISSSSSFLSSFSWFSLPLRVFHYALVLLGGWLYSTALLKMMFFGRGKPL